jgi:hypothetical protein
VTRVVAVGVDNEQYIVADLSDRLQASFAVVSPIVLLLQSGTAENPRCIIEAKPRSLKVRRLLASSHSKSMIGSNTI